jgi:hypothetical protein
MTATVVVSPQGGAEAGIRDGLLGSVAGWMPRR